VTRRESLKIIGLTLAFLVAALWPLAVYPDLHLRDFPNHMARAFILLHPDDPVLMRNFRIAWAPLPDIGWDLWALALGRFMSLVSAAKFLIVTSFVLGIGGCFALARIFTDRWTATPLLAFPFFLNGAYGMGFLSFTLGLSVALWAMAWWAATENSNALLRLAVATGFATLLYLIHFYAFAIYGVFILGFELPDLWRKRRDKDFVVRLVALFRDGLQAAPAVLLFVLAQTTEKPAGGIEYLEPWIRFGNVALMIHSGRPWTDIGPILAYASLIITAQRKGWLSLSPRVHAILALYVVLFLILPDQIINTAYVAWRTLLPLAFVGIAALAPTSAMPRRIFPALLSVAFAITLAVPLIRNPDWQRSAQGKAQFLSAIEPMAEGGRIFFAHSGIDPYSLTSTEPGIDHVAAYAVIEKRALVKSLFVLPGQHVLRFRDESLLGPTIDDTNNTETILANVVKAFSDTHTDFAAYIGRFDYVVLHGEDDALETRALPMDRLTLLKQVGAYRLFRVGH
jgi:hypothetical protein